MQAGLHPGLVGAYLGVTSLVLSARVLKMKFMHLVAS
jgi:hypothetical protein